jgi:L-serine/L-threonine ammonia-lyase
MLVELACATTLAPGYNNLLLRLVVPETPKNVVFVVCGGFKINLQEAADFKLMAERDADGAGFWQVGINGDEVTAIEKRKNEGQNR